MNPLRIPQIRYRFDPIHGAALSTSAGRPFWGVLGGYTDSVTGRGGGASNDGSPFINPSHYPQQAPSTAPSWCTEEGRQCLRFDGVGTYLALPQGVLPRRGAFRLTMTLKPEGEERQILFTHRRHYIGSLTVWLDQGKLGGSFTTDKLETFRFNTELEVPCGLWSNIRVIHDLQTGELFFDDCEQSSPLCFGSIDGLARDPSIQRVHVVDPRERPGPVLAELLEVQGVGVHGLSSRDRAGRTL